MKRLILLSALVLAGCAHNEPVRTIEVPVYTSCIPKGFPEPPKGLETRETLAKAPDDAELMKRLYADWKERVARMLETEAVIQACR